MKILFFAAGPELLASSRTRVYQYIPFLSREGIRTKIINYISLRHCQRNSMLVRPDAFVKFVDKLFSILQVAKVLILAGFYDVLFIQKVLLPKPTLNLLRLLNANIVFDFDDAVYFADNFRKRRFFSSRNLFRNRFDHTLRVSKHIIVENVYNKEYVQKFNKNVSLITGPIDTVRYVPRYSAKSGPERNEGKLIIGWIGSPDTTGYLGRLDKVFIALAERFDNLELVLIGSGSFNIEGVNIAIKKWSIDSEVGDLQGLDIGIMPLDDDEWTRGKGGYKLLQYMAVGIPCVASPVGVNSEIVKEGVTGFLAGSDEEWINRLSLLLNDENLRVQMGRNGRLRAEEFFSYEASLPKFLEAVDEKWLCNRNDGIKI